MNTSVSRITRVVDMLDEAYAGPCSIARDPRPSRKVVSTLQVSRFMARQVHNGIPGNAAVGSTPSGQPPEFTYLEGSGQVGSPRPGAMIHDKIAACPGWSSADGGSSAVGWRFTFSALSHPVRISMPATSLAGWARSWPCWDCSRLSLPLPRPCDPD